MAVMVRPLRPLAPKLGLPYAPAHALTGMGVIVDYFAGGGGASTGLEMAFGRKVDLAVNHNPKAVAMHMRNHPETEHACEDVFRFDLVGWLGDRLWDAWWLSPDCTHHSRAKGGKPLSNKRRALADVACEIIEKLPAWQRPRVLFLENVPEFVEWGPLGADGRPDKTRKGEHFRAWVARLEAAGYVVEWREKRICANHGAPTTRTRLMLIARCDGLPIVWPEGGFYNPKARGAKAKGRKPWKTAASDVIDFTIPGRSIFGRKKPLADPTLTRVARGIGRFVLDNPEPFIVHLTHHKDRRVHPVDEAVPTVTCAHRGELAIVEPVISVAHGDSGGRREYGVDEPLGTVHASGQSRAIVSAHVTKFRANSVGHAMDEPLHTVTANSFEKRPGGAAPIGVVETAMAPFVSGITQTSTPRVFDPEAPLPTITTAKGGELLVASAHMLRLQGADRRDRAIDEPLGAVCAGGEHHAQVAAFMAQFNNSKGVDPQPGKSMRDPLSTVATKGPHQGVVEVDLTTAEIEEGCERVLAFMLKYYGSHQRGVGVDEPLDSVTTKDRFALITVHIKGVPYRIYDIRIRMLTPRELFNAQGFPQAYVIAPWLVAEKRPTKAMLRSQRVATVAKRMSKADSIAMCGNSVPPPFAFDHAKHNAPPMSRLEGVDRWERRAA